jgi:hypothetical protein
VYNKLFSKILFSSIWTEDYATRIVWVMFLAAMDEDGVVQVATPKNVAALAQVTLEEAERALAILEGADPASSNPEHDGRRLERFPGGWRVLNARAYRDIATRDQMRERTAERVRRHRAKSRNVTTEHHTVTLGRQAVTADKHTVTLDAHDVTPSEAYTETEEIVRASFDRFWAVYPKKDGKANAAKAWRGLKADEALVDRIIADVRRRSGSRDWRKDGGEFIPLPTSYLRGRRWEDEGVVETPTAASSTVDAERARTVELVKHRESLLRGDLGADQ